MQKITPFLWFDGKAEEAARFYTSIFKKSKMRGLTRYGDTGPGLNGGPQFPFTEAMSFVVNCETQDEIDYFWEKLSAGGQEIECGWLNVAG
jgi:predicted 3-demethylubiquinone-9 3-methyltransferase (glyoxalase superfamily)